MSFSDRREERFILTTLRKLPRQRVALILQPRNIWVVEKAVLGDDRIEEALRTCHLRGWVELIKDAVPHGELTEDGKLPEGERFSGVNPIYRLTEAGWNAINRTHQWVIVICVVASATLVATIIGLILRIGS